jgi:hypothetical protein
VQFGNDDVASKVCVTARASLVGLSSVSDGFSCALPCHHGDGSAMECPCGNDDGQPAAYKGFSRCKPAYYSCGARRSSQIKLSLISGVWPTVIGQWWCPMWSCSMSILVHLYRFFTSSPLMNALLPLKK